MKIFNSYNGELKLIKKPTVLPKGKFSIVQHKDSKSIKIVEGNDTTNRCLLMCGRSDILTESGQGALNEKYTTGKVINVFADELHPKLDVCAILEVGQRVVMEYDSEVLAYSWNGESIIEEHFYTETLEEILKFKGSKKTFKKL